MLDKKVLFIGGGNMAEGIIRGLINTNTVEANNIIVSEIIEDRQKYLSDTYHLNITLNVNESIKESDVIVLAVRPQDAKGVVDSIKDDLNDTQIFISICAGIDLDRLNEWTNNKKLARVMPNVLIEARHGYSGVCISDKITKDDEAIISELLNAIGQTIFINENLFNEFTAFSCAGPAYVLYFAAAMIDAGVEAGFSRKDATAMTIENLIGTGMMLDATKKNPYQITDTMTSPAGVTIEGLHVLAKEGFNGIVMDCVRAAINRGKEF